MAARNHDDLGDVTYEIIQNGGSAIAVSPTSPTRQAGGSPRRTALLEFGTIDTWVNNAGLSIYGKLTEVPLADKRQLFDINFWGVVHGCRTAVRLMRRGVLINIGSEVSDVAIPLQGIYSASKHAVKGYTDALRMELEHDRIPIAVTLVKPSAINTPYPEHARNYMTTACRRCRRRSMRPRSWRARSSAAPSGRCATSSSAAPAGSGGDGEHGAAADRRVHGTRDVQPAEG